jgi:hypothetical protein
MINSEENIFWKLVEVTISAFLFLGRGTLLIYVGGEVPPGY